METLKSSLKEEYAGTDISIADDQGNKGQVKGFRLYSALDTIHIELDENSDFYLYGSAAGDDIDTTFSSELEVYRFITNELTIR